MIEGRAGSRGPLDDTRRFYTQLGRGYDRVASNAVVAPFRRRLADAAGLRPGDTVIDVGTGSGANLPYLRERVGPSGTVVGIDVTPALLHIAAGRPGADAALLLADGTDPPVGEPVDAIVGSFVTGMFDDPVAAVGRWIDRLADGGRIALLDAAPREDGGSIADELARVGFRLGATPGWADRHRRPPETVLYERVSAAHDVVGGLADGRRHSYLGGFVRVTAGRA